MMTQDKLEQALGRLLTMDNPYEEWSPKFDKFENDIDTIRDYIHTTRTHKETAPNNSDAPDWQPSYVEEPENIHFNRDARAWAEFFVSVYPQHKHMEDVMICWFANAMMAMHDSLMKERETAPNNSDALEALDKLTYRRYDPDDLSNISLYKLGFYLRRYVKEIRQALQSRVDGGWMPIESAPENELALLYCPDRGCPTNKERIELGYAAHGGKSDRVSNMSYHSWATHWMPLPNPPKKEGE